MSALRIGVLSFAHVHAVGYLASLAAMPDVEVRGSDPDGTSTGRSVDELRGRALADALGVGYADTYEELLAWRPDAVVITSENARHRELVELAAGAGAHILCEKPLATSWEDGLAMRDAAASAGVLLMVAFPVRFASVFQRLRAEHAAGALGRLVSVRGANNGMLPTARDWFTDPALAGGGALVDHIVHIADLLDGLMGSEPLTVTAVANRVLHAGRAASETAGLVTITYANGVIAAIDCSWSRPDTSPVWGGLTLSLAGTSGTVEIDFFGQAARGIVAGTGRPLEARYGPDFDDALLATFVDAVRTGTQPQPDVHVGLRTLSIVLAAQESARTGRTVHVLREEAAPAP
ncbi:Gfo/Idh/MocA family oxidoreductase [Amnibacterium sp. CER49]|uniref:Gfo/Idh/MocA family protein n=1 Tax=Amnibacterium sp. CER49 TaxID=3039161 RepID=UPI0024498C2C|nr:Gfo/Idh/MocA family oxidoreductase [Amnibacterium sp. CER49]MDH2444075.1 Gfo/Idh/MocA family oxidoreductase [Amnibacterium sp. CER49]